MRSDLYVELSGQVDIPQDVLEALENNGVIEKNPDGNLEFSGQNLRWDPMYTDLVAFMKFLSTLDQNQFSYARYGDEDAFFAGRLREEEELDQTAQIALDRKAV